MPEAEWPAEFETILRAGLPLLPDDAGLKPDVSLSDFGLDSLAAVSLLIELEEAFQVSVPDDDLTVEIFSTPANIWSMICRLRSTDSDLAG